MLDLEKLRTDLIEYYGSAMPSGFPMAVIDLVEIERAAEKDLIRYAKMTGISIRKYEK